MENERNPADENLFGRDSNTDFASGPLSTPDREDAKSDNEDEDDERWEDELDSEDELDAE